MEELVTMVTWLGVKGVCFGMVWFRFARVRDHGMAMPATRPSRLAEPSILDPRHRTAASWLGDEVPARKGSARWHDSQIGWGSTARAEGLIGHRPDSKEGLEGRGTTMAHHGFDQEHDMVWCGRGRHAEGSRLGLTASTSWSRFGPGILSNTLWADVVVAARGWRRRRSHTWRRGARHRG